MVHQVTSIQMKPGNMLVVGYSMCFSEPTVVIDEVSFDKGKPTQLKASLSFAPEQLDAVIAALEKVRGALPKAQTLPR